MPFEVDLTPEIASERRSGCSRTRTGRVFGREEAERSEATKQKHASLITRATRATKLRVLEKRVQKELNRITGGQPRPYFDDTTFIALSPAEQLRLFNNWLIHDCRSALNQAIRDIREQRVRHWGYMYSTNPEKPVGPLQEAVDKMYADDPAKQRRMRAIFSIKHRIELVITDFAANTDRRISSETYLVLCDMVERVLEFSSEFQA